MHAKNKHDKSKSSPHCKGMQFHTKLPFPMLSTGNTAFSSSVSCPLSFSSRSRCHYCPLTKQTDCKAACPPLRLLPWLSEILTVKSNPKQAVDHAEPGVNSQHPWLWRERNETQLFISRILKIPRILGWWRWDGYFLPSAIIWNAARLWQMSCNKTM